MTRPVPKLSIVCPAFQEEEVLPLFHQELCSVLAKIEDKYEVEILYVDDGSRDRTLAVIRFAAADFRLMSRRAVHSLLELRETHRFLRGLVQWLGYPTIEVTFKPVRRKAGVTKYTVRRMMNFALDALLSFSKVPLRLS